MAAWLNGCVDKALGAELERVHALLVSPSHMKMDKLKSVFWGLLYMAGGFWFWHSIVGNPINELALIQRGATATAFITDTWEDSSDDDRGKAHFFHGFTYAFRLPNDQTVTIILRASSGV